MDQVDRVDLVHPVGPAEVVDPAKVVGAKAVSQRSRGPSSLGVELSPKEPLPPCSILW